MPKQRITREMVVEAAFETAREQGSEQVMVKNIAARLGCSVQPIYSYCRNMDSLRRDLSERVRLFVREYIAARTDKDDLFRSTGHAYIQLAKDEPNLFRIFILHTREGISSLDDLYRSEAEPQIAEAIAETLNIGIPQARQLHLNMLIFTIGMGTIFSVSTPGISADEIFAQQEIACKSFLKQATDDEGEVR